MLLELAVNNYAIIDSLNLKCKPGFTAFTGETGAGKSILVGAIALLLGGRASTDLVRTGEEEAVIEARFDLVERPEVRRLLDEGGFAAGDELVVRRIISRTGRGRCSLNGRMAPLSLLREMGTRLLNIYGQHEYQSLLTVDGHLDLLDAFGGCGELRESVRMRYAEFDRLGRLRDRLEREMRDRAKRENFLDFQIREIEAARLEGGEEKRLRERRKILAHGRRLREVVEEGEQFLYAGEDSAYEGLADYVKRVTDAAAIDPGLASVKEALDQAILHVEEARDRLREAAGRLEFDPREQEEIEDRLAVIQELGRKYGSGIPAILAHLEACKKERSELGSSEERLRELTAQWERAQGRLLEGARVLTEARRAAAGRLSRVLERELSTLEMKRARFVPTVEPLARGGDGLDLGEIAVGPRGADIVEFLLSANPGEEPRPLARIASGGELSRIMLALRRVLERSERVPTLIFDEVDSGIGGQVAEVVGQKLAGVARDHQVFVVTHLPQIARWAGHHYHVGKVTRGARTLTEVRELFGDDRVREVARMLAGDRITEATLAHAEEMLAPPPEGRE